jgi:hypothetical protein
MMKVSKIEMPVWAQSYVAAVVKPLPSWVDVSDSGSVWDLIDAIEHIANVEGPVHIETVHERLRQAWNIGRIGARIQDNIVSAIKNSSAVFADSFLYFSEQTEGYVPVRYPGNEAYRRVGSRIHQSELSARIVRTIADAGSASEPDVLAAVSRLFGWERQGAEIASRLSQIVEVLESEGQLVRSGRLLWLATE